MIRLDFKLWPLSAIIGAIQDPSTAPKRSSAAFAKSCSPILYGKIRNALKIPQVLRNKDAAILQGNGSDT